MAGTPKPPALSAEVPAHVVQRVTAPKAAPERSATTADQNGHASPRTDSDTFWLGRAFDRVADGYARNETGLWLACQLRDAGVGEHACEAVLLDYAATVRHDGPHVYTDHEAQATVRSVYSRPAREGARSVTSASPLRVTSTSSATEERDDSGPPDQGGPSERRGLRLFTVREVLDQPIPDPLIGGMYSLNSTGLLYAKAAVGKSVLLLDQMGHVSMGQAWHGRPVHAGHVVYVVAEGAAFLGERLRALMLRLQVDDLPCLHLLPARIQLLDKRMVPELLKVFRADLPAGEPLVWVAIDTLSQTAGGADENDATQMAEYVGALERIREATGAFIQVVHHAGKDASRGARGSSVLSDNFDTVVEVTQNDDGVATAKCTKQRGRWTPFAPFSFRVQSLALDEYGDETGPVLDLCDVPQGGEPPETQLSGNLQTALTALRVLYEQHPDGVFKATWRTACETAGIKPGSFYWISKRLERMGKVDMPDTTGRYFPVT